GHLLLRARYGRAEQRQVRSGRAGAPAGVQPRPRRHARPHRHRPARPHEAAGAGEPCYHAPHHRRPRAAGASHLRRHGRRARRCRRARGGRPRPAARLPVPGGGDCRAAGHSRRAAGRLQALVGLAGRRAVGGLGPGPLPGRGDGDVRVLHRGGRRAHGPSRRRPDQPPGHQGPGGRRRARPRRDRDVLHPVADRGQRDDDEPHRQRRPRAVGPSGRAAPARRRPRAGAGAAAGHHPRDDPRRHPAAAPGPGDDRVRVGQPRRARLRRPGPVRRRPQPHQPPRLRLGHPPLPGGEPGSPRGPGGSRDAAAPPPLATACRRSRTGPQLLAARLPPHPGRGGAGMTRAEPTAAAVHAEVDEWVRRNWDPDDTVEAWWDRLARAGYAAPMLPPPYGRGWSRDLAALVTAALVERGALGPPAGLGLVLAVPTIVAHGTDEQKERFVWRILNGQDAWCQLFSEPGAGSDLASLQTRAVRDGDEWVVTGQKVWTSTGQHADWGMLLARTNPDAPKHQGITYFAFPMRQPGVDVRPLREMTGRALFNEVFLDGARVAHADVIGGVDNGWAVANTTLAVERASIGSGGASAFSAAIPGSIAGHLAQRAGDFAGRSAPGGEGRVGAGTVRRLIALARDRGRAEEPAVRQA